ncbi:MAG: flagellin [Candidatus Sulfotelmatobacter sp.]
MPLGILNNIPSLSAENELTLTSNALNTTLEQLSSGSRINSGADDPAGLSIANGLEANISALTQSVSNANDGVGELQLADGALAQVTNLLNTAVTLATESATGTVSNSQRVAIQAQYASILAEINQIGTATTYNGQSVFQGGAAPNLNAADSANNATTAPLNLNTVLTVGGTTTWSAGGVTDSFTAASTGGANPNEVTGAGTGLTAASILATGATVTATRGTGTTIYTATAPTTVGALENAINTGAAVTGITVTGTDSAGHTGYQAVLNAAGSLQVTDLNGNSDLTLAETGTNTNQVITSGGNLTNNTVLANGAILTLTRSTGTDIYTVGAGGSTVGELLNVVNGGAAITGDNITVTGTDSVTAHTGFTAALQNGNLAITNNNGGTALIAVETGDTNTNEVTSTTAGLLTTSALGAGDVFTATRNGAVVNYTVGASGTTVASLLTAINTGATVAGQVTVAGVAGASTANYTAVLSAGGNIQLTDGNNNKDVTFVESGATNIHAVSDLGTTLVGGNDVAAGTVLTLTRGTGISTYTVAAGATTYTELAAVIQSGVGANGVVVGGADVHTGYTSSINGNGNLLITDTTASGTLTAAETVTTDLGTFANTDLAAATGTYSNTLVNGTLGALAANPDNTLGAFTANAAATSTVQNLINAINSDTTVGAKATLTNGQVVVTDPEGRADLAVSTTDTLLGALVAGASTNFATPTTSAAATPDLNELLGNAGGLTAASALTNGGVTSFTAGGKTFSFTANTTNGLTVGALIAAINNPTDTAGLQAYLTNGNLEVVDPNNNSNVAVNPSNTETVFGTFTNPSTTASTLTNIFLSDSTAIGSTQIAISIGGLTTTGLANGSGGNPADLASTDLDTQTDSQAALVLINQAISNVASVRGTLGASVNRLTAASNVINSQVQNLTSAENTITAADIPTVVANLTKYSILEQTGISALAQANQQQQLVLKLLQ